MRSLLKVTSCLLEMKEAVQVAVLVYQMARTDPGVLKLVQKTLQLQCVYTSHSGSQQALLVTWSRASHIPQGSISIIDNPLDSFSGGR